MRCFVSGVRQTARHLHRQKHIDAVHSLRDALVARQSETCDCAGTPDYDMQAIWQADEGIRSLESLLLFGMRGVSASTPWCWVHIRKTIPCQALMAALL